MSDLFLWVLATQQPIMAHVPPALKHDKQQCQCQSKLSTKLQSGGRCQSFFAMSYPLWIHESLLLCSSQPPTYQAGTTRQQPPLVSKSDSLLKQPLRAEVNVRSKSRAIPSQFNKHSVSRIVRNSLHHVCLRALHCCVPISLHHAQELQSIRKSLPIGQSITGVAGVLSRLRTLPDA